MDIDYSFTAPGTNFRPPVVPVNRNLSKLTTMVWKMGNAFSSPFRPLESSHTHTRARSRQDTGRRDGKKRQKSFYVKRMRQCLSHYVPPPPPPPKPNRRDPQWDMHIRVRACLLRVSGSSWKITFSRLYTNYNRTFHCDREIKTVTTNQNNTQHNPWALNNGKTIKSIWATPAQFSLKTHSCGTNEEQTMAAVPRVRTPRPSTSKVFEQKNTHRHRARAS